MQEPSTLPLTITNIALAAVPLFGALTALFAIAHEVVAKAKSARAPKNPGRAADFRLKA